MANLKLDKKDIQLLACEFGLKEASINTVVAVESGGQGFDRITGKIIIQFEPTWFKRKKTDWQKDTVNVFWQPNGVENQYKEWIAFNSAFKSDANAAMESTSIGLMQVMGFHFKLLGFKTVGAMWDYAKESEFNQLRLGLLFIKSNPKMFEALKTNNFDVFAYYYNGSAYRKYNYHTRMKVAFDRFNK